MGNYSKISALAALAASVVLAIYLVGCGRFFVPVNTGSGSTGSGSTTSTVETVLVANNANGTSGTTDSVGVFNVSSAGAFSAVGTNVSAGTGVSSIIIAGGYVYVADVTTGQIDGFSVATGGALTTLSGFPFTTLGAPIALAGAQIGSTSYLYVLSTNGVSNASLIVYTIASGTGALTQQSTTYTVPSAVPQAVRVSPNGKNLYVALGNLSGVQPYTINSDGSLGALTALGFSAASGALLTSAYDIVIDSSLPTAAYIADFQASQVVHCTVASDGSLTIAGDYATGTNPFNLTIDHAGAYLYVANNGSSNVSAFGIGATGNLTTVSGSPFAVGSSPRGILADPTGQWVFVTNAGGSPDVSVFSEASGTGVLTSNGTATTGGSAIAIVAN